MTIDRTVPIVAVFGDGTGTTDEAKKTRKLATRLGCEIKAVGAIVLTGRGVRDEDRPLSVKRAAVDGARSSLWIGVDREDEAATEHQECGDSGFVITTDLGYKRNYLEASMCDAAIALDGKRGTRSEFTSALSRGRPVALVGETWRGTYDRLSAAEFREAELDALCRKTLELFAKSRSANTTLNPRLEPRPFREQLSGASKFTWFDAGTDPKPIVVWIMDALADTGLQGCFPLEVDEKASDAYDQWLEDKGAAIPQRRPTPPG